MGRIKDKRNGIPSHIRVGAAMYKIVINKDKLIEDGSDGYCNPADSVLVINSEVGPQRKWQVLVHELLHAIEVQYNIKLNHRKINQLESALYQLLKDNRICLQKIK